MAHWSIGLVLSNSMSGLLADVFRVSVRQEEFNRNKQDGDGGDGSWMVADAATADGTAAVRIALWRCAACGVLLIGVGRPDADPDAGPGSGIHAQEFTWLEDARAPVLLGGGNGSGPVRLASGRRPGGEPGGG